MERYILDASPTVEVERREAYGLTRTYPTGQHAATLQKLTGRQTIERRHIDALKALGINVVDVRPTRPGKGTTR